MAMALLQGGAQPNLTDTRGTTAVLAAAARDDQAILDLLLEAEADVNFARLTDGVTALQLASQDAGSGVVRALLAAGASATSADDRGVSALHIAAQRDDAEIAGLLVAAGADADALDNRGNAPRDYAGPAVAGYLDSLP